MEVEIDLIKERTKKSYSRVLLGVFFLLLSNVWIITRLLEGREIGMFYWVYFVFLGLSGVCIIIEGFGYPIVKIFGKAYISTDSKSIAFKVSVLDKRQSANWDEIKSIDYKINKYEIKKKDNTSITINLSKYDYATINKIKEAISSIANEKGILLNL